MSLITPDFGLLFWMTLIFGIVFFVLAKFGFPAITGMVEKRSGKIEDSLRKADEAEKKLASIAREQERLLEEARLEQSRILKEASEAREKIISTAREEASREAEKIFNTAKTQIAAERESAIRDIRHQVSLISLELAEKVIRKKLEDGNEQLALLDRMVDEASKTRLN
ncbi:MAG: F0F1 ATP synthase subunit B [Bacteroidales bacterium]|nr:F0F1 ATP synthase subunit B [Bacteroidales bacterium]